MSHHYDDLLVGYYGIKKICEFLVWKFYWPTLCHNVKVYVKGCDICLVLKAVRHKPYGNFQLVFLPTHQ